jgi:DNA-binding transcriptional LysR family regulator
MNLNRLLDGRLKIRHLVLVSAIAEQGSVVGAAERLRVTQPVVTRGLRELEAVLGVELFERGPRGVTLTVYGRAFVADAKAILAQIQQAGRHVVELNSGATGTVVVGNHLCGGDLLLPRAICRFKVAHPLVTVVVREASPDRLDADLLAGDVDMVIGELRPGADPDRTSCVQLYAEPVDVVVRAGHPATALPDPRLTELLDHPWILPNRESALLADVEQAFFRLGLDLPANRIECTSKAALRDMVLGSDMIAVLPTLIPRADSALTILPVGLPDVRRIVGVTLARNRTHGPAMRLFLDHLRDVGGEIRQSLTEPSPSLGRL